ncbi:adenylate/guanylate cyclase domain-containing protein [Leptospira sp. 'Mane']|uniref:adenylate/guanylate cyclase domain-containing protein n=1 Tax=Leptospira sp. 'Mane' TaxID=3387407 RepID=UPI00398B0E58
MKFIILLTFVLFSCSPGQRDEKANIQKGKLNLESYTFTNSPFLSLTGEWDFFWNRTPETIKATDVPTQITLPSQWNDRKEKDEVLTGQGFATFRIHIILPKDPNVFPLAVLTGEQDTSHAIYVNGKYLGGSGKPGTSKETTIPQVQSSLVIIPYTGIKEIDLDLLISNFAHRKGGPWNDIAIAPFQKAQERLTNHKMNEAILASVLGFVALFFLFFYFFDKDETHTLGIFAFSFVVLLRNISTGERILLDWLNLPYQAILRIEYFSWFWAAPVLFHYFQTVFPIDFPKKVGNIFYTISLLLTLALLLPSIYFTETASVYPIIFVLNGCFLLFFLVRSYLKKRSDSQILLFGSTLLLIGAINDTLHAELIWHTTYIGPLTVVCFVFLQVFTFGKSFRKSLDHTKELAHKLSSLNSSYSRFVPKEFLNFLGKTDIREIALGQQVQKKMTILFADIRSFTEFSEQLTPKENFDFLNSYLQRVGPIIRHNGGFIDKFIGDAIMALFPDDPNHAIRAAVQMQSEIRLYNTHRANCNYRPVQVGIGIHTGTLILGILGEHERMEGTVISDAVNLASRIEGVTKMFGASIVISADTFIEASDELGYDYRLLDRVNVKGKADSVFVVEVLNGYDPEKKALLSKRKDDYTIALEAYRREDYAEAEEGFSSILDEVPHDSVSKIFLEKSRSNLKPINLEEAN